jgi:short-subunit dehydrogenase
VNEEGSVMAQEIALVTGASSGIGAAFAHRLAREGRHVALVARRADVLERLAETLRRNRVDAHAIAADLTRPGAVQALAEDLERRGCVVDWLVNNAGFGTYGAFHELPLQRELEEIQLNVSALVELTGRFLPGMVARKRGAVINVASVAGFAPGPYMATYCATKAFVKSFSEAVAAEVSGTGVDVLCVCPGFTRTEFQTRAEVDVSRVPNFAWMSAEAVADEAVKAVGRKAVLVSGTMNSMTASVIRLLPTSISGRIFGAALRR